MRRLWRYYGGLNLQNKLRFSYILLILIPVTLLCGVYYWTASQSILDIAKKNILDVTVKNQQIIDRQLEAAETGAMQLNVDRDIYKALRNMDQVPVSELMERDQKVRTVLKKYFSGEEILSANLMTPGFIFGDNSKLVIPNSRFYESKIYQQLQGKRGEAQWIPTYPVEEAFQMDFSAGEKTVFTLAQELNPVLIDPERPNDVRYMVRDPKAVLIVNFNEEIMDSMFAGSNSVINSFYCISTRKGAIVAHSDSGKNGTVEMLPWLSEIGNQTEGSLLLKYDGEPVVVCYAVSEVNGWIAASVTPVHNLLNNVSKIQIFTIVVWLGLFVLAMFLAAIFSKRITKPVGQLVMAMKQVGSGNFSLRLTTSGTDEMQYLTTKYNEMGEKIQVLIEENYKSEIRKKESEIMALNLQLNPHFLYNTLNIVNMMALEEGNMEVSQMLISLSDMLQYTFRNKQELVVFEEEYLWLQNYLHIMQVRFEGKFEVYYEVSTEIYQYKVPKLLLQPIIENAIVHGFRSMESGGQLTISGCRLEEKICLVVADNGKGMNEEELAKAMNADTNRIGLTNAVRRLQLIYGEEGSLIVKTAPGEGTRIEVRFPS